MYEYVFNKNVGQNILRKVKSLNQVEICDDELSTFIDFHFQFGCK